MRVRDLPLLLPQFMEERESIVEAIRLLDASGARLLLTACGGCPAVVQRSDLEAVLPSPATLLARYEIPALLERIRLCEAVRGPAPLVHPDEGLRRAVAIMREWEWRPLVVVEGSALRGVVSVELLVAALADAQAGLGPC